MEYPSLFREECFPLETGLRGSSEKALFTQGYGDQHTYYLPGGAFLHSESLQHRPGFGGGGLKGGWGTPAMFQVSLFMFTNSSKEAGAVG